MAKKYIGVDVGGTSIKLGIVDDRGEVLVKKESIYTDEGDGRTAIQAIKDSIRELIEEQDLSGSDISGIGVSAAGCINSVEGCVAKNGGNVPGWSGTEVCRELTDEFGYFTTLANDANCAVLGELWAGAAMGYTDVVGVTLGTGVGGGMLALVNFFTVVVTVVRGQKHLMIGYVLTALTAKLLAHHFVGLYGIMGAVVLYTGLMTLLALTFAVVLVVCVKRRK